MIPSGKGTGAPRLPDGSGSRPRHPEGEEEGEHDDELVAPERLNLRRRVRVIDTQCIKLRLDSAFTAARGEEPRERHRWSLASVRDVHRFRSNGAVDDPSGMHCPWDATGAGHETRLSSASEAKAPEPVLSIVTAQQIPRNNLYGQMFKR